MLWGQWKNPPKRGFVIGCAERKVVPRSARRSVLRFVTRSAPRCVTRSAIRFAPRCVTRSVLPRTTRFPHTSAVAHRPRPVVSRLRRVVPPPRRVVTNPTPSRHNRKSRVILQDDAAFCRSTRNRNQALAMAVNRGARQLLTSSGLCCPGKSHHRGDHQISIKANPRNATITKN